jgi:hypothetical protein
MQGVRSAHVGNWVDKCKCCIFTRVSNSDRERISLRQNRSSWVTCEINFVANGIFTYHREIFSISNPEAERIHIKNGAID